MTETRYTCWIDGLKCRATFGKFVNLESCRLCQDTRIKKATLKKGMNPYSRGC